MSDPVLIARSPADLPSRTQLLAMSGLEFMQAMLAGQIPHPTIAGLMGYRLTHVAPGRVTLTGAADFGHTNPFGAVHGGWYGTVLDTALGCTVMTAVPQGRWYTTLEYKVNITRALPLGMEIEAEGLLDHAGRSTAVAHATIRGRADGRVYATGSTTCIIMGEG
ncbi:PaaI family thioesterase [Gemmobacter fulvus]|uniref:PaaI family thioesterase n=1 Tax=Gemmobacter fulvus TaxID=2840474 RepID=A0A975S1J7_9RHOB|nr:PaaI family thioesterase [Gemmobacter fulvus]MBT9247804.1 PaaI family thioesterase [Gemmobacter fulvus]QWK90008.1 PaaI family thioesterase [Gemmobacter fulvus]